MIAEVRQLVKHFSHVTVCTAMRSVVWMSAVAPTKKLLRHSVHWQAVHVYNNICFIVSFIISL
jgi:hypothetical protein